MAARANQSTDSVRTSSISICSCEREAHRIRSTATTFPGTILFPIGLLVSGWGAQEHTHWIVPDIVSVSSSRLFLQSSSLRITSRASSSSAPEWYSPSRACRYTSSMPSRSMRPQVSPSHLAPITVRPLTSRVTQPSLPSPSSGRLRASASRSSRPRCTTRSATASGTRCWRRLRS